jgi:transposase
MAALPKRRQFSAAYKRHIVREANARQSAEVSALLSREGLYSSHLTHRRKEVEASERLCSPTRRGPKPDVANAESRRVEALEREGRAASSAAHSARRA